MSSAFSSIKQGLEEALEFSQGKVGKAVIHKFSSLVTVQQTTPTTPPKQALT